jgi:hypothetical protein
MQRYVITVIHIPSVTTNEIIYFTREPLRLRKAKVRFIFELASCTALYDYIYGIFMPM